VLCTYVVKRKNGTKTKMALTNGCTGQISAVTFFVLRSKKAAIKNLLGEPGVRQSSINQFRDSQNL
jgi:hypothetical protein